MYDWLGYLTAVHKGQAGFEPPGMAQQPDANRQPSRGTMAGGRCMLAGQRGELPVAAAGAVGQVLCWANEAIGFAAMVLSWPLADGVGDDVLYDPGRVVLSDLLVSFLPLFLPLPQTQPLSH